MEKKMNPGKIICGKQVIPTISAFNAGNPRKILLAIASGKGGFRTKREFGQWKDGLCSGHIWAENLVKLPVQLKLGTEDGLHLYETSLFRTRTLSLKPREGLRIPITDREITENLIHDAADQIVAVWVGHGIGWKNRKDEQFALPFGTVKSQVNERDLRAYLKILPGTVNEDVLKVKGPGWSPGTKGIKIASSLGWAKE